MRSLSSLRTFSIRALLLATGLLAIVLAVFVVPGENRRRAVLALRQRGYDITLQDDPTDPTWSYIAGFEFEPPSRWTYFTHRTFPEPYVRKVRKVAITDECQPIESDFGLITRLGDIQYLDFRTQVEDPQWLESVARSDCPTYGLAFRRMEVGSDLLRPFGRLTQVQWIGFDDALVNAEGLHELRSLSSLRSMWLHQTGCGDEGLQEVGSLTSLANLEIRESGLTDVGIRSLKTLTNLKHLEAAELGVGDEGFACLKGMRNLKSLDISGNPVTDKTLESLKDGTQMRSLVLESTEVDGSGLRFLSCMASLRLISLRSSQTTTGMEDLAKLPALEYVDLSQTPITDKDLAPLRESQSLKRILLHDTQVTDEALEILSSIPTLRTLDTSGCKFTDQGRQRLRSVRPDISFN